MKYYIFFATLFITANAFGRHPERNLAHSVDSFVRVKYINCTSDEVSTLNSHLDDFQDGFEELYSKVKKKKSKEKDKKRKRQWRRAIRRFRCMKRKLKRTIKLTCKTYVPSKMLNAEGLWPSRRIWFNRDFISVNLENPKRLKSVFIHELSHLCGTNDNFYISRDAEYQNSQKKKGATKYFLQPQNYRGRGWSNVAETYEFWLSEGLCTPELDCEDARY